MTAEGQNCFFHQGLQQCFGASTVCQQPTLYFLSSSLFGLYSADSFEKKQRSTTSPTEPLHSVAPSSCSPPTPPSFVNFMDLSANGFPPHRPSHIWHLQAGPSRPLSFPVAPPLALSGRSEPAAGEGGGSSRLVLFTLLTGVLLSSQMISVDITSAHHPAFQHTLDSIAVSPLNDSIVGLQLTIF